jgi:hypothetical protein
MNMLNCSGKRISETGSALVYILIAIALLAALTASFMRPSSQQTTAQGAFNAVTELKSQLEFIRSSIQECVLTYPQGDRGADGISGLIGTDNTPYPINPSDTYFTSPAANDGVQFLRCPGNPGDDPDHAPIFGGASGKFLPPAPDLFEDWQYYNGTDGVFYYIYTDKSDAFLQTALSKLDENFSECQADVIDASGGDIELTSTAGASDPKCLENTTTSTGTCFRLWVIIQPSAVYNGDADGEETAAGC